MLRGVEGRDDDDAPWRRWLMAVHALHLDALWARHDERVLADLFAMWRNLSKPYEEADGMITAHA